MVGHEFHQPGSFFKEHVEEYWKKMLETPKDRNFATDRTGDNHDVNTNPVFLGDSLVGPVTRSLKVSGDKSFFIPINAIEVCERELEKGELEKGENESLLQKHVDDDQKSASIAKLTIDGTEYDVKDERYRIRNSFEVDIPKNALDGLGDAGKCKAKSYGYYVMLKPLSPGKHIINIVAQVDDPYREEKPWKKDVTYEIDVT
jgi:hypothetical protein